MSKFCSSSLLRYRVFFSSIIIILVLAMSSFVYSQGNLPQSSDDIVKHLEYMGYECSISNTKITAKHKTKLSFDLIEYDNGVLIKSWFPKKTKAIEEYPLYLKMINSLNNSLTASRCYIDSDNDLIIEAWYPGIYEKKAFTIFIDAWEKDFNSIAKKYNNELGQYVK